tara:strand:+ start:1257 stop:1664 length:408 start_codon:yes stop_codon:yes gene_type:complete
MKPNHWLYISVFIIFTLGCSTAKKEQLPAPHNNYTGLTVDAYFSGDGTVTSEMMRACSKYGGLDQNSINNSGDDLILQDIISYKCNFANRSSDEITIDGKSVKRLSGSAAKKKCEELGFQIGTTGFPKCLRILTQ